MDKLNSIKVLEKYKSVSRLLGLPEDEKQLNEIVEFISSSNENNQPLNNETIQKKTTYGEVDFQTIVSSESIDLSSYMINSQINSNQNQIIEFWHSINNFEKENFTIFELNIILYLISKKYNKYQKKDKKKIINIINNVVKEKRMEDSYNSIVV